MATTRAVMMRAGVTTRAGGDNEGGLWVYTFNMIIPAFEFLFVVLWACHSLSREMKPDLWKIGHSLFCLQTCNF